MKEGRENTSRWSFACIRPLSQSLWSSGNKFWRSQVSLNLLKEWDMGWYMSSKKNFQIVILEGNSHVLEYSVIFKMPCKVNVGKSYWLFCLVPSGSFPTSMRCFCVEYQLSSISSMLIFFFHCAVSLRPLKRTFMETWKTYCFIYACNNAKTFPLWLFKILTFCSLYVCSRNWLPAAIVE